MNPSRRERGYAILLCALGGTLFLAPALFTGRFLSPAGTLFDKYPWRGVVPPAPLTDSNGLLGDAVTQFEPWLAYTAAQLHQGRLPLWSPSNMLGAPLFGNLQSAVLYPGNWVALLWPGGQALVLRVWLTLFIAALGSYLLAREVLGVRPAAAALAATSFAFGASLVVWLHSPLGSTEAWLPWLWWASARLLVQPTARRIAGLGGIVALSLLAGHPETAYLIAGATGLFALFQAVSLGAGDAAPRLGRALRGLAGWMVAYLLGAALAAVQLLPFVEYLRQSAALLLRADARFAGFWLPARYAWTLISPDLFGNPARSTWWGGPSNYNESNAYGGVLVLLLTVLALVGRDRTQRRLVVFLLALAVLTAGVIYRAPFVYDAAQVVPLLHTVATQRLLLVLGLALALLGALGADTLATQIRAGSSGAARVFVPWMLVLLVAGIGVPLLFAHEFFTLPRDSARIAALWNEALARSAAVLLASGTLVVGAIALRGVRPILARGLVAALPLVLFADLWRAHADYQPTVAPSNYVPATPATSFLQAQPGLFRVVATGWTFLPNTNLDYGLSDVRGYDAIMPQSYFEVARLVDSTIRQTAEGGGRPFHQLQSALLNLLNVRYLLAAPDENPNYLRDVEQGAAPAGAAPIGGGRQPGQTFVARRDNLTQIQVLGTTGALRPVGRLIFHLKTAPGAATDLVTQELDTRLLPDNAYWMITFPPISGSAGHAYYFYFEAPDTAVDPALSVQYSAGDPYRPGTRMAGEQAAPGDLIFTTMAFQAPDNPRFVPVLDGGKTGTTVFENRQALPRAWLVHAAEVQTATVARLGRLRDPTFNGATTALLNAPLALAQTLPATPPAPGADAVQIVSYAPDAVRITTQSLAAGLLVLSDQDFPGWRAWVNDTPAPILNADEALRAVYLPAGAHQVRFAYQPASFRAGLAISAGAGLLCLILGLWPGRRPRSGGAA